jgi:hypothetical protein
MMASTKLEVIHDSELMTNLVSANPVSAGNHFGAFIDQQGLPAVLSLSSDGKLWLTMQPLTARYDGYAVINFGEICGITGKITGFNAMQAPDKTITIAIAAAIDEKYSKLLILPGLRPGLLLNPPKDLILGQNSKFPSIQRIFMVSETS